jgi:hypothetical protein
MGTHESCEAQYSKFRRWISALCAEPHWGNFADLGLEIAPGFRGFCIARFFAKSSMARSFAGSLIAMGKNQCFCEMGVSGVFHVSSPYLSFLAANMVLN